MPTGWGSTRRGRSGRPGWAVLVASWMVGAAVVPGLVARAQAPAQEKAAPAPAPAPAPDEPAAAPPPAPDADPAAAEAAAKAATDLASGVEEAPAEGKSLLRWAIEASGPIGGLLVLLSIYFTALVVRLFLELRVKEAVPPALVERLDGLIKERKFQEAYDACREDNSFLAKLVRTGVANLPNGRAEAKEAMAFASEEVVTGMEARISILATIGTLGPMIGLVGTIWGMIMSFRTIATAAGAQPRANEVAEGISTALFITLEGITLATPAIFFFALFRNRIAIIALEANKIAEKIVNAFVAAAKPQAAKA